MDGIWRHNSRLSSLSSSQHFLFQGSWACFVKDVLKLRNWLLTGSKCLERTCLFSKQFCCGFCLPPSINRFWVASTSWGHAIRDAPKLNCLLWTIKFLAAATMQFNCCNIWWAYKERFLLQETTWIIAGCGWSPELWLVDLKHLFSRQIKHWKISTFFVCTAHAN